MINRCCDKCGKELEPPTVFMPFYGCTDQNTVTESTLYINRKISESKFVPVDLCPECEKAVYDFIYKKENWSYE